MSSMGQQFAQALPRAEMAFVMPGPDTTRQAPTRPLRYEMACAAYPAACSCRVPM